MKKQLLRDILHDLAVVCCVGAILDIALLAVFFVIFWITAGLVTLTALNHVRTAFLIVSGLTLLICAGVLMFGRGLNLRSNRQWTKYFHRFELFPVVLGVAMFPLVTAIVLDYLLFVPVSL